MNIIEWLNSSYDAFDAVVFLTIVFIVWYLVWRLFLRKWLYKHDVSSVAYGLYELGAAGVFGLAIFFVFLMVLFIGSFQMIPVYGIKMFIPLTFFWGIVIVFFVAIIRAIRKK